MVLHIWHSRAFFCIGFLFFMPYALSSCAWCWKPHRPDSRYKVLECGRGWRFSVNAAGIAGDAEHPGNRTPETRRVAVGKRRNEMEMRSKGPGAGTAEWVSRERSGRRRAVGYADRTKWVSPLILFTLFLCVFVRKCRKAPQPLIKRGLANFQIRCFAAEFNFQI